MSRLGRLVAVPLLWLLRGYKRFISPALPPACRYEPTCSIYAMEAIQVHGPLRGSWLAGRRLCRCHPWGGHGWDPVPPARGAPARRAAPPDTPAEPGR